MKKIGLILFLFASISISGQSAGTIDANENDRLKITKNEKQRFAAYIGDEKWKIIKILNNPCDDEKITEASNELCLSRKGFSYGSHYSFSARVYYQKFAHVRYATLSFIKDKLVVKSNGQTIQILLDLGEREMSGEGLPREIIDLAEFPLNKPLIANLRASAYQISFRGLLVTNNIPPLLNHGYLIRSVFMDYYQTFVPHPRETIYYFQVVEKNRDSLILLWREMFSRNI